MRTSIKGREPSGPRGEMLDGVDEVFSQGVEFKARANILYNVGGYNFEFSEESETHILKYS